MVSVCSAQQTPLQLNTERSNPRSFASLHRPAFKCSNKCRDDTQPGKPSLHVHRILASFVYLPLLVSFFRRSRYNIRSCAVIVMYVLTFPVAVTSSSSSSLSQNALEINIGILAVETCDVTYRSRIEQKVDQAIADFQSFVKSTEGDSNPSPVQINHNIYPFCRTRDVITNIDTIFGNDTIRVVLSISSYDIHSSLIPLAEIYDKSYILVNTYTFLLAQTSSISFAPKFSQSGLMLATVLDRYKWQNICILYSNFNHWMNFATYMYYAMTSYSFNVKILSVVPSPTGSENVVEALTIARGYKVIVLLMDVDDQLAVLAMASSLSMTTSHAFFAFTKTPYDMKTQSLIGATQATLKQQGFFNDSQAKGVNILESLFVLAFSFPQSTSMPTFTTPTRISKRDAESHQFKSLLKTNNFRLKRRRYFDEFLTDFPGENSVKNIENNFDKIRRFTMKKRQRQQWRSKAEDLKRGTRSGLDNDKTTGNSQDSQTDSKNTFVPTTSFGDSSLSAQARHMNAKYDDVTTGNLDSSLTSGDLSSGSSETTFDLYEAELQLNGDEKEDYNEAQNLIYETERRTLQPVSSSNIDNWTNRYLQMVSNFRYKRDIENFVATDTEIFAIYDIVFLLALAVHIQAKKSNKTLTSDGFISTIANLSFPGQSGMFQIDKNQQVSFDFSLYDFDGESGVMSQRIYYQASSSGSWVARVEQEVSWPGGVKLDADECFKQAQGCNNGLKGSIIASIVISALTVIGVVIVAAVAVRRHWVNKEMIKGPNKVILCQEDLVFVLKKEIGKGSRIMKSRVNLMDKESAPDLIRGSEPNRSIGSINELSDYTETARYNGDLVHIKELKITGFEMKNKLLTFIRMCRDLRHENLNPYVGFLADPSHPSIVVEYCSRGSLYDIVHNNDFKLDWDFKLSLLTDLVRGIRYLHSSPLRYHGHLTSKSCVIDSRFVLKVTDYGVPGIMDKCKAIMQFNPKDLLWSAPELLRDECFLQRGCEKGDIYALAIIFQEVALRTEPYSTTGLTPEEIVKKLKKPPPLIRPSVTPQAGPPLFIQIMKQCWSESPEMRLGIDDIYDQFKKLTGGKKANIVDTMFKMLEKYSTDLEDIVAERTMQLEEEKKKTDQLLFRMLPPTVAENLKIGRNVEAEVFDEVTIYFSDIVGFTTISAMSTPMQVVDLLNDLYSMFDATISNHDVYKVETIGDAYMVVSGLPVRNGNRHAGEIGTLALVLLSQCGQFTIRHMPQVPLRIRIGLHTGSCVAGVVGLTMPRFCLFGDTVNTASRMESSGVAFRIHISEDCKVALDILGGYKTDYRGQTELKGKGLHNTYWLIGKEGFDKNLPEPPTLIGDTTHGLDSIIGDLKLDVSTGLDLPQNDIISKSNSAPNLATPTLTPKVANPLPSSNEVNAALSHPDNLHELYKHKNSKTANSSADKADISLLEGGVKKDKSHSSSNKRTGNSSEPNSGTCQSRHSESNDSGFGSERKHSEGNDGYNWANYSDAMANSDQFKHGSQYTSNRTSNSSSSNVVFRKSYMPLDGDDLTTVTEV